MSTDYTNFRRISLLVAPELPPRKKTTTPPRTPLLTESVDQAPKVRGFMGMGKSTSQGFTYELPEQLTKIPQQLKNIPNFVAMIPRPRPFAESSVNSATTGVVATENSDSTMRETPTTISQIHFNGTEQSGDSFSDTVQPSTENRVCSTSGTRSI